MQVHVYAKGMDTTVGKIVDYNFLVLVYQHTNHTRSLPHPGLMDSQTIQRN